MTSSSLPPTALPAEAPALLLLSSWIQLLAEKELSLTQQSRGASDDGSIRYTFGDPTGAHFAVAASPSSREIELVGLESVPEEAVRRIIRKAVGKAAIADFGDDVVYRAEMETHEFQLLPTSGLHFIRILGDQVRIVGPRRLSDRILLNFTEELQGEPGAPMLFAPKTSIDVTIFAPGPTPSDLSRRAASGVAEMVAAICAVALGRAVEIIGPPMFPAQEAEVEEAKSRRHDESILTLARNSVSLDVFGDLVARGGPDAMLRARGALLSYHAALKQANPDIATMLFVTAIEALIVPRPEWRKEKATKRFIEMTIQLCPDVVDSLVNHHNVEQAFGYQKRGSSVSRLRKDLLDRLYDLRSTPSHSGIGLSGVGLMMEAMADAGAMRAALLSDLARGALLAFLEAPRSSLIGHPMWQTSEPSA